MAECGLRRLQVDSSVYHHPMLDVTVVVHVDDLAITGSVRNAEAVMTQIQNKLKIKKIDRLKATGDQHELLGRQIRRTERGYALETSDNIVQCLLEEFHLQQ